MAERVGFALFYPNLHKGRGLHIGVEGYILGGEMEAQQEYGMKCESCNSTVYNNRNIFVFLWSAMLNVKIISM